MENVKQQIENLLKEKQSMRDVYRYFYNVSNDDLLKYLLAQKEIEKIKDQNLFLQEVFEGYRILFKMNPVDILEIIKYKSDVDIRMEFEKMKQEKGIYGGKPNFSGKETNSFKTGIPKNDGGAGFGSGGPNSFNL
ncbi:hypothetical protein LDC_1916 [sediment metagenome]|uniref:Uncharacterized protein n=1 Tax=sediment metagenome TaxID=749907 RepID=D9PK51_9ZZZZ